VHPESQFTCPTHPESPLYLKYYTTKYHKKKVQNEQSETTTKQENNEVVLITVFGTSSDPFI